VPTFLAACAIALAACANSITPPDDDLPARDVPITFTNDGVSFSGTLWLPAGEGPYPAVVLIGGSGPWRPAHWYFDILRDSFRERGIAVAYYDRRGEGGSGGDFDRASFEELADDAISAVEAVRGKTEIRPGKVGVWGHSMGGWIAGLAASRSTSISFVVTAAGPGVNPIEQTLFARANEDRTAGIAEPVVLEMAEFRRKVVEYYVSRSSDKFDVAQAALDVARTKPWYPTAAGWRELQGVGSRLPSPATLNALDVSNPDLLRWFRRDGAYDHRPPLVRLRIPYLAIFGESDPIVPREPSIAVLQASLSSPASLTVRSYPGANHMIMTASGQGASGLANGYVSGMRDWIIEVAAR
jgi:pimeloyl-ACP methyl ester carboxylesterase